ncbi:MAG: FkbM family methyltransferase, partial [Aureliella sp.]
ERNKQQLQNVRVLCAAVSDRPSFTQLEIAARGRASNSLSAVSMRSQAGGVRYAQDVLTITLDDMLSNFRHPNIVKIDVEGAEALVLSGATKLLSEVRPVVYIEVGDEQAAAIAKAFRQHHYLMFNGEASGYPAVNECVFNTLAIPEEHALVRGGGSSDQRRVTLLETQ